MAQHPPAVTVEEVGPTTHQVAIEVANALLAYVAERPGLEQSAHAAWLAYEKSDEAYRSTRATYLLEKVQGVCDVDGKRLTADARDMWVLQQTSPEREMRLQAEDQYKQSQAALRINDETQKSYRAILRAIGDER